MTDDSPLLILKLRLQRGWSQEQLAEIRNKPQAELDEQQLRQYTTMNRNVALAQSMLTLCNASR